ncbi:MAG: winged helix-turn-helix domain-containing protein [Lachnospiraceae bacterium]|nr:winged helix-turn-helix domain-containing protein [Lachnospiraceae bacterium]
MIIKGFRWVYIIGSIVVIAGVMGFGSISAVTFGMDHHSAILMLGMVPIMTVAYYVAMSPVVKMISSKISNLTEAMDKVAEGDLSVRIDTKNAGEFKKAYKQQLMDEIWGYDTETDYNTIKVYVNRLRNKLKDCTEFSIISSRGVGYKAELKD